MKFQEYSRIKNKFPKNTRISFVLSVVNSLISRKIYSEDVAIPHACECVIVVYMFRKEEKKYCLVIFHSSSNLDVTSRNQIRKYATGAAVTGNIQLRLCLRAYWPPLEFPRMPWIRPRLLLFAYTSPQSLERLRENVVSHACIIARNIPRSEIISSRCRGFTLSRVIGILCWPKNNCRTTIRRRWKSTRESP